MSNKHIKETKVITTRKKLGDLTVGYEFVMDKDDPAHEILNLVSHNHYRKEYPGFAYRRNSKGKVVEVWGITKNKFTSDTEVEKL